MTKYAAKVKECSSLVNVIRNLKSDESVSLLYGEKKLEVRAYKSAIDKEDKDMSYSIWNSYNGMNISKIGNTTISAYTYDMMSQKTTYTFNIDKIRVI
tara:strand:- start:753 stop:1046 length:294 start_codon:yes stop_codon:yes gene_type:complete